jgi:hypothetical protein
VDWIGGEEGSSEMGLNAGSGLVGLESTSTVFLPHVLNVQFSGVQLAGYTLFLESIRNS